MAATGLLTILSKEYVKSVYQEGCCGTACSVVVSFGAGLASLRAEASNYTAGANETLVSQAALQALHESECCGRDCLYFVRVNGQSAELLAESAALSFGNSTNASGAVVVTANNESALQQLDLQSAGRRRLSASANSNTFTTPSAFAPHIKEIAFCEHAPETFSYSHTTAKDCEADRVLLCSNITHPVDLVGNQDVLCRPDFSKLKETQYEFVRVVLDRRILLAADMQCYNDCSGDYSTYSTHNMSVGVGNLPFSNRASPQSAALDTVHVRNTAPNSDNYFCADQKCRPAGRTPTGPTTQLPLASHSRYRYMA